MPKKKNFILDSDWFRVATIVIGSAFSIAILVFSVFAVNNILLGDMGKASIYLLLVFLTLGLSRFMTYIKDRSKINLARFLAMLISDIILGVVIYFGKFNAYLYSLSGGLFCLSVVLSRVFRIIQKKQLRTTIFNLIVIALFVFLAIGLFIPVSQDEIALPVVIVCFLIAITAIIEVFAIAMSQLKLKTLFKIVLRTYALEILLGLLTMVVASALVLSFFEPNVSSFGDGLWYAFAVVTTIGFGDIVATTIIGRVISVILGLYGIVVVAVITSIIVNFYNETAGKKDAKEFKDIHEESKDD